MTSAPLFEGSQEHFYGAGRGVGNNNGTELYGQNETGWYYNDEDFFSLTFQVTIYVLYNSVFIAAVLGNVLVCYVVFSCPRMRTVTNYLIANLAVGDLLMAVFCVPFSYIPILYQYWPFGQVLCHVLSPAQAVCVFVSAYTLVALAGDRYMAILYPLQPRLRRSQALAVILLVWAIAILTAVPIAVYTKLSAEVGEEDRPICQEQWTDVKLKLYYGLALMILQYFFPLAVLVFTYTRIALAVWGKKAPGEAEDGRDKRLAKAKRKMIKMMLTVMIVYTLSWLPFNALMVCADVQGSDFWSWGPIRYVFFLVHWMAMSHTVCNPIIYCWMNSRFRVGFRSAVAQVPFLRRLSGLGKGSRAGHRLNRMGTCTTYTFASPNNTTAATFPNSNKLRRGSSMTLHNRINGGLLDGSNHHQGHQLCLGGELGGHRRSSPYLSPADHRQFLNSMGYKGGGGGGLVSGVGGGSSGGCAGPGSSSSNNKLSSNSPHLHPSPVSMLVSYNNCNFLSSSAPGNKGGSSSRRGSHTRKGSISESFM